MVIRKAALDDTARLAEFAERTFRDAFAGDNDPADMDAYCREAFSADAQRAVLNGADVSTLLALDPGSDIIGYAQLRTQEADGVTLPAPLELWRFYVDRVHHGRGVAQALMAAVMEEARLRGAQTVWLGVWERNLRAQAFYRKFGFSVIGSHQFLLGTDLQTDLLMARAVRPD
jgi:ribosomal protein S18 acetylase RimI-like enzyme